MGIYHVVYNCASVEMIGVLAAQIVCLYLALSLLLCVMEIVTYMWCSCDARPFIWTKY
jgi:hypothetical protein